MAKPITHHPLLECLCQDLPSWALKGFGTSSKHDALFRKWALEDIVCRNTTVGIGSVWGNVLLGTGLGYFLNG